MTDDGPAYDEEYGNRLVVICCAMGKDKKYILSRTALKKSRLNHYEKGRHLTALALAEMGGVLDIAPFWLRKWLEDEDRGALNGYDRDRLARFEALPDAEQINRAQELGWWRERGKPRKPPQSARNKR